MRKVILALLFLAMMAAAVSAKQKKPRQRPRSTKDQIEALKIKVDSLSQIILSMHERLTVLELYCLRMEEERQAEKKRARKEDPCEK